MAVKTTLEQLEEVQAAITKVMTAQDTTIGDKRVTMANLAALQKREDILLSRYKMETAGADGGGMFNKAKLKDAI